MCFYYVIRYLDDVSLHHLINALCSLSLEAMEMASGNNKVNIYIMYYSLTWLVYVLDMSFFMSWLKYQLWAKNNASSYNCTRNGCHTVGLRETIFRDFWMYNM